MLLRTRLKYTQASYIVCHKANDHLRIGRQKPLLAILKGIRVLKEHKAPIAYLLLHSANCIQRSVFI